MAEVAVQTDAATPEIVIEEGDQSPAPETSPSIPRKPKSKRKRREVELLKKSTPIVSAERTSVPPPRLSTEQAREILGHRARSPRGERRRIAKESQSPRAAPPATIGDSEDPHRPSVCAYCNAQGTLQRREVRPHKDGAENMMLRYDCSECGRVQWIIVSAVEFRKHIFGSDDGDDTATEASSGTDTGSESEGVEESEDEEEAEDDEDEFTASASESEESVDTSSKEKPKRKKHAPGASRIPDPNRPALCKACKARNSFRRRGHRKLASGTVKQTYECGNCGQTEVISVEPKAKKRAKKQRREGEGSGSSSREPPSKKRESSPPPSSPRKSSPSSKAAAAAAAASTKRPSKLELCTVEQVAALLAEASVPSESISVLRSEQIDGAALKAMSPDDFRSIGIKYGPMVKIRAFVSNH